MNVFAGFTRWLAGFEIKAQLLFSFFLVLLLTAGLGGFSVVSLGQLNAQSHELADNWMVRLMHTTSMRSAMLDVRDLEVKHAHAPDAGYMDEYEDKMKQAEAVVNQHRTALESLISSDDERAALAAYARNWTDYLAVKTKVVALHRADKQDDAIEVGEGAGKSAADDAIVAIDKLTTLNFEGGQHAAQTANAVYARARVLSLGLVLGAVLIGLALAAVITRGLLAQLGGEPRYALGITQRIAAGDLAGAIALKAQDSSSLLHAIGTMRHSIAAIVGHVREGSQSVANASAEIAQGNSDLSNRTEQQASALEQTAATMEELSAQVRHNADNAQQATQLAVSASTVAVRGGEVVGRVVTTMQDINQSSRRIGDIISVIDGIAFQTNILALNAAVEAARAGDHGRGFAVVASEVRSLAGRSADAAREIKTLINASMERVEQGTALVDQAGSTMVEVVSAIRRVTDLMGEISSASSEQASGVAQVGEAVAQMEQATQQNAALVEQMAASAGSLKAQAGELVHTVAVFKLDGAHQAPVPPMQAARPRLAQAAPSRALPSRAPTQRATPDRALPGRTTPVHATPPRPAPAKPAPRPLPLPLAMAQAPAAKADEEWETF